MKERTPRRPWSRKTWKAIALTLISLLGAAALAVGGLLLHTHPRDRRNGEAATKPGSWDNINQEIAKAGDWQKIVHNSPFNKENYPAIDGSTTMVPLAMEFARQHLGHDEETAKGFAQFSTTGVAYEKLFNREIDLFIGTMPGKEELALAERNGITPVMKPICWDSFVFITHRDNPVEGLSAEQLRGIFSGEITGWEELGGRGAPIRPFRREPGAGSQTGMEKLIMQGVPMAESAEVITGMGALVEAVADPRGGAFGIGYTYSYYIGNLYKNADIKTLSIDGAAPTDANVVSGAYSLRMERYGVIRGEDEQAPGGLFLDWILSGEGQACVRQAGYIPLEGVSQ